MPEAELCGVTVRWAAGAACTAGFGAGAAAVGAGLALFSQFAARRAKAQVPPDGKFVDVDGARLHYVDIGEGPAIVMIHGLGGQVRNFSYALTERLPGRRLILIDRPRSGYSTVDAGEPGLKAQADLIAKGIDALGPLPADTVFFRAGRGDFDLVVAMYHDQGHGPVKVMGLEAGVNITVGLPVIRTSVDHGTAFDIAGRGVANPASLTAALRMAAQLGTQA